MNPEVREVTLRKRCIFIVGPFESGSVMRNKETLGKTRGKGVEFAMKCYFRPFQTTIGSSSQIRAESCALQCLDHRTRVHVKGR